jgi:hypothetical protein
VASRLVSRPALSACLVLAAGLVAACTILPTPEVPDARTEVGPWVAFSREAPNAEPDIGAYLRVRGIALGALHRHHAVTLSEPTDSALIPGLLRVEDQGGASVYRVTSAPEPPDAWVLSFRVPPASDGGAPVEALVVVEASSGDVLMVHAEPRDAAS